MLQILGLRKRRKIIYRSGGNRSQIDFVFIISNDGRNLKDVVKTISGY